MDTSDSGTGEREIDPAGEWAIPGMLDVGTHYGAEVLGSPGLVRVPGPGSPRLSWGSYSLSTVYADAGSLMPGLDGPDRMINRNDHAVAATVVAGHVFYEYGLFAEGFGTTVHAGQFLQAR
ncbi:hypothetical protein [Nocardia sp. NPDC057455]|uniref:hypothetical protein n=1 Tax=Nocardia sp. NPDC057455 TaxID=3346138 RepID=UPI00366D3F7F